MILTQYPVVIDLSRPALDHVLRAVEHYPRHSFDSALECEVDNFRNLLQNLLERSKPGNLDLVGG